MWGPWFEWGSGGKNRESEIDVPVFIAEVVKTPDGPAPLEVRRAWVGEKLMVVQKPSSEPEMDFVNMALVIRRDIWMTPVDFVLDVLREHGKTEVAEWFDANFPPSLGSLSFSATELSTPEEMPGFRAKIKGDLVALYSVEEF